MADEGVRVHAELVLPEGAVVQNSLLVVAYFDENAVSRYAFAIVGESSLAQGLGLLDIAKAHMLNEAAMEFGDGG